MGTENRTGEIRREADRDLIRQIEQCSFFIASERLGLLEQSVARMACTVGKRKRGVEFNAIVKVIRALRLVPPEAVVAGLAYGCLEGGDAGLFIITNSPTKVVGSLPEGETKHD